MAAYTASAAAPALPDPPYSTDTVASRSPPLASAAITGAAVPTCPQDRQLVFERSPVLEHVSSAVTMHLFRQLRHAIPTHSTLAAFICGCAWGAEAQTELQTEPFGSKYICASVPGHHRHTSFHQQRAQEREKARAQKERHGVCQLHPPGCEATHSA